MNDRDLLLHITSKVNDHIRSLPSNIYPIVMPTILFEMFMEQNNKYLSDVRVGRNKDNNENSLVPDIITYIQTEDEILLFIFISPLDDYENLYLDSLLTAIDDLVDEIKEKREDNS